ncbi:MAG: hypothetical protein ACYC9W_03390 [Candidatus Limnocylindria bacterium]
MPDETVAATHVFLEAERAPVSVAIQMLDDERDRALDIVRRNEWPEAEGLHSIFSRGLVALEHAAGAQEHAGTRLIDMKTPEERDRFLLARLNDLESKYAVMKFTAYNALKDNGSLKMNVTGLSTEYQALSSTNAYLRGREDDLKARVAELEARERPPVADLRSSWRKVWDAVREAMR